MIYLIALLSEQIEKEFKFFLHLHWIFGARPNVTPIVITTGLGPQGMKKVWYQPPDDINPSEIHEHNGSLQTEGNTPSTPQTPAQPVHRGFGVDLTTTMVNVSRSPASTPAPNHSISEKENQNTVRKLCAPKASVLSQEVLNKARLNIQRVPQKRTLIDTMLDMQAYVIIGNS
jgi:hypothetical protein